MFRFMICGKDDAFCRQERRMIAEFCRRQEKEAEITVVHSREEIIRLDKKAEAYDAFFLDVDMDGKDTGSGIEFGGWLMTAYPHIILVFLSEQLIYAPDGYRVGAARYIMKDEERFAPSMEECLTHIMRRLTQQERYIAIDGERLRILVDRIFYVDSKAHKITYHIMENRSKQTEYEVYGKLDDVEQKLAQFGFCRIHQSYLVNMRYVQEVMRYKAVCAGGEEIQISKRRYKQAWEDFVRLKGTF